MGSNQPNFPEGLEDFFDEMMEVNGPILVLRGYDHLPTGYGNDIDIFVPPERVHDFIKSIGTLKTVNAFLSVQVCRLGLIKGILHLDGNEVPLDIMFQIGYCGLTYQDGSSLVLNSCFDETKKIKVPALSDEIRISILKELLHNRRAREDKLNYLTSALANPACDPTSSLFDSESLHTYQENLANKKLEMFELGAILRRKLFLKSFLKNPASTMCSIVIFFYVKYILKGGMLSSRVVQVYMRSAM